MTVTRLAFALVAAPVSLSLGFAAATVSFTAWNIMVPLLLNGFGLSVPVALFVSVMLDACNSATLTLLYGYHGKVDWWYGAYFGTVSAVMALIISNVLVDVVQSQQGALSGIMFVFPFLLSMGFLYKGTMVWWRRRKALRLGSQPPTVVSSSLGLIERGRLDSSDTANGNDIQDDYYESQPVNAGYEKDDAPLVSNGHTTNNAIASNGSPLEKQSNSPAKTPTRPSRLSLSKTYSDDNSQRIFSDPTLASFNRDYSSVDDDDIFESGDVDEEMPMTPMHKRDLPPREWRKPTLLEMNNLGTRLSVIMTPIRESTSSMLTPIKEVVDMPAMENQHAPLLAASFANPIESNPIELPEADEYVATSHATTWQKLVKRFKPERAILTPGLPKYRLRIALMAAFSVIMGALSGSLFIGGGMMFALATASLFRTNVRLATGTGAFICCITMFAASISFLDSDELFGSAGSGSDSGSIEEEEYLFGDLAYYLLICVPCGIVGAIAGVHLALKISDTAIFFFISAVLFSLGVFIAIQSKINESLHS